MSLAAMSRCRGEERGAGSRFSRLYAPHFGMFHHHVGGDPLDQISFLADEGFHALEDSGLRGKPVCLQARIGEALARRSMSMGLFTGIADFGRPTFASGDVDLRKRLLGELESAIETARRVGGRYIGVVPGKEVATLPASVQMRHAADTLQFCSDACESHDLVLVLEPIDHGPGRTRLFLRSIQQAAELCRRIGRKSCKLLFDVYQQALGGEDLPRLVTEIRDAIGYVQLADTPGRKEPGTGTLDFGRLFAALDNISYTGILGMEHGNAQPGRRGERAVINAYASIERFYRSRSAFRIAARHSATSRSFRSKTSIE